MRILIFNLLNISSVNFHFLFCTVFVFWCFFWAINLFKCIQLIYCLFFLQKEEELHRLRRPGGSLSLSENELESEDDYDLKRA